MSVITKIDLKARFYERGSGDLGTPMKDHVLDLLIELASGTSADQADLVWSDQRSLNSASEDLDIRGSLADAFGATLNMVEVVAVIIHNTNTTPGQYIDVFGDANGVAGWQAMRVGPKGLFVWASPVDGAAVTAGTGDIIQVDSSGSGANVTYQIVVLGRSA